MNILEQEIESLGGPSAVGKIVGASAQRVINWRARGRVPADVVISYCECREWAITPHQLRPDIYPHPHDGLPESMRLDAPDPVSAA